jgi:hypothetical protein
MKPNNNSAFGLAQMWWHWPASQQSVDIHPRRAGKRKQAMVRAKSTKWAGAQSELNGKCGTKQGKEGNVEGIGPTKAKGNSFLPLPPNQLFRLHPRPFTKQDLLLSRPSKTNIPRCCWHLLQQFHIV